jgi:hypothetical protein
MFAAFFGWLLGRQRGMPGVGSGIPQEKEHFSVKTRQFFVWL